MHTQRQSELWTNSQQSGQRHKRKQWQHVTSEQAIFHSQQQSNSYLPDTMTLWCVATLQYQLQLQWRHFLTLHDKIQWEYKNDERCNDCSEKMRGVFDGTNKIKLKWFHQYKKDAASGCEKNANDKIFSKYPLPIKTFMYDVKIQSMALSHFGRFCHF